MGVHFVKREAHIILPFLDFGLTARRVGRLNRIRYIGYANVEGERNRGQGANF